MAAPEVVKEAFALLDVRGTKTLNLTIITEFVACFPKPPSREKVYEIYKCFDEDDSGDIDEDEFHGVLKALSKEANSTVEQLTECYVAAQYRRLFQLVDSSFASLSDIVDDSIVDKDNLKVFLDLCSGYLNKSSADLVQLFRQNAAGKVVEFRQFRKIVGHIIKGKSISTVVNVFTETQRKRKESTQRAREMFKEGAVKVRERNREEEDQVSSILKSSSSAAFPEDTEPFKEAFALMDSRGGGVISIEAIYEFCETFPNPPPPMHIRKLYSYFDEDGSGDIDPDEFLGLCMALERLTGLKTHVMCDHFKKAMYRRLFELVDEGGDKNSSVSKDELRVFLEAISPLLSNTFSTEKIYSMVKGYDAEELNFNQFCGLIEKLIKGRSISQVVQVFEETMRQRKAKTHQARRQFETDKKKVLNLPDSVQDQLAKGKEMRVCFACIEKSDKIRDLQREVDLLKAELSHLKEHPVAPTPNPFINKTTSGLVDSIIVDVPIDESEVVMSPVDASDNRPQSTSRQASPLADELRALMEEDLRGNPFTEIRQLQSVNKAPYYAKFPQLIKPALHSIKNERLRRVCDGFQSLKSGGVINTDSAARRINELLPSIISGQQQLQSVLMPVLDDVAEMLSLEEELQRMLIAHNINPSATEAFPEKLDLIQSYRMHLSQNVEDIEWILDSLVEEWTELNTEAISAAPFLTKRDEVLQLVTQCEEMLQTLLDRVTIAVKYSTKLMSDAELQSKRIVNKLAEDTDQNLLTVMAESSAMSKEYLSKTSFEEFFETLAEAGKKMAKMASTSTGLKRDKCCNTLPIDNFSLADSRKNKGGAADKQTGDGGDGSTNEPYDPTKQEIANRSSSPRQRAKTIRPKDIVSHVDRLLSEAQMRTGLPLPENFRRIDPNGNTFQFGTKKIELSPAERSVVVKVGGGYLLFEEFCEKYCQAEMRRVNFAHQRSALMSATFSTSMHGNSSTGSNVAAAAGSPLASALKSSSTTHRGGNIPTDGRPHTKVLVRTSEGLLLK